MAYFPVVQPTADPTDSGHEKVGRAPIIRTPVASQQREDACFTSAEKVANAQTVSRICPAVISESHREGE